MERYQKSEKEIMSHYLINQTLDKSTLQELRDASTKIRKRIRDIDRDIYDRIEHTEKKENMPLEEERYILKIVDSAIYEEIESRKCKKTNYWISEIVFQGKG